nr:hypothetical protein BaRGS_025326 [Batillaria attramentaria]
MVDQHSCLWNYDLLKFSLPLPCVYRMTRLRTRTGCDVSVNLVMSPGKDGKMTQPARMTYMVSDPHGFDTLFYPPGPISMNGVEVFCYSDQLGFKSVLFPSCAISLHFQPDGYAGVYSRNFTDDYTYSRNFLCGDCDGGKGEMGMLGSDVIRRMRTWEDRTAAMLMYTSRHIVGGDR